MSRQFRRKGATRTWKVLVPEELALNVELMFYDENTKKLNYGARSRLVTSLLDQWYTQLPEEEKRKLLETAA